MYSNFHPNKHPCAGAAHSKRTAPSVQGKWHSKSCTLGFTETFCNTLVFPAFWNRICFLEVTWPPHPATLDSPPLYLHCICAQMSTHVSRLRQTKRSRVWHKVHGIDAQIHKKIRECILMTSLLPGMGCCFCFCRSTFAQRKSEIWGAQVGALSKVPTDRSAQLHRSHLLTVWTQLDQNPTARLTPPWPVILRCLIGKDGFVCTVVWGVEEERGMGGAEAPLISPPRLAGQQGWRDLRGEQSPVQHGDPPGQKTAPHTCQDCQIFLKNTPALYGMWLVTLLLLYSLQEGKRKRKIAWDISSSCAPDLHCFLRSWLKSDECWKWVHWRRCLTSVARASMAHRQPSDEKWIKNDSKSKCFQNCRKIDSDGEIRKRVCGFVCLFFFLIGGMFCSYVQRPLMALGARIVFALPTPVMNM